MSKYTTDQLLGVRSYGPEVIGQEMFEAKEALLKLSGDGTGQTIYGPAIVGLPPEPAKKPAPHDGPATPEELNALSYSELRGLAAELGKTYPTKPSKVQLVEELLAEQVEITVEDQA